MAGAPARTGATFQPTSQWKEVLPGQTCPAGLDFRMDLASGRNFARMSAVNAARLAAKAAAAAKPPGAMPSDAMPTPSLPAAKPKPKPQPPQSKASPATAPQRTPLKDRTPKHVLSKEDAHKLELQCRCGLGDAAGVRELLEAHEFPAAFLGGALFEAARRGHADIVHLLLENGASPTAQSHAGMGALHFAAQEGHEAACLVLVQRLPDRQSCSALNSAGETPIALAHARGHITLAQILSDSINSKG
jgi:hypothetical protein